MTSTNRCNCGNPNCGLNPGDTITSTPTTSLTPQQLIITDLARTALEASEAETDPDRFARHTGPLEHHVQALLDLVTELTVEPVRRTEARIEADNLAAEDRARAERSGGQA